MFHLEASLCNHSHLSKDFLKYRNKEMDLNSHRRFYLDHSKHLRVSHYPASRILQQDKANTLNFKSYIHTMYWLKFFVVFSKSWSIFSERLLYSSLRKHYSCSFPLSFGKLNWSNFPLSLIEWVLDNHSAIILWMFA